MYAKVLVPLDGSDLAAAALPHAANVTDQNSEIILLQVVSVPLEAVPASAATSYTSVAVPAPRAAVEAIDARAAKIYQDAEEMLAARAEQLRGRVRAVQTMVIGSDDPADTIASVARDEQVDIVVMSSHGRTGLRRIFAGSVAEKVLRSTPGPILLVRHGG
ncbi:MAG: universal stress protein [Chloroflexi bacterium]|nr:universal stress protein [Chloroflexota bacterium]